MGVRLQQITAETVRRVTDLAVAEGQRRFVATNAESLAEALFSKEAWYRAVVADDELVGFCMLHDETQLAEPPPEPKVFLWRFMIDARFQGRGLGAAAIERLLEHVRTRSTCARARASAR